MPPSPASGTASASSRGGRRRSSSPPDPELEAKIRDVVGLYLHPPAKAVVLCVDEKPRATFDYVRHGTTTLFAALEVATGRVTDA
jgi:hypothetical protein